MTGVSQVYVWKKRKAKEQKFQMKLMNCKNKKERDTFHASETSFHAHKLHSKCLNDKACAIIFPNCLKLLHLMLIFLLSTACVERFCSKMKLVKTRLWNQLSQVSLENILFFATEAPNTGWFFCLWTEKKNNSIMRIDVWSTLFIVFDYQAWCTLLQKTSLFCLSIFCDNTIIVYAIVFFR